VSRSEREHPRYAHRAALTVVHGAARIPGHTSNVSRGGICATLDDPLPVGAECFVELTLVFDDDTVSETLRLPARLVWCTHVDDACQIGLVFTQLDATAQRYLALFLRYLDDHRPAAPAVRERGIDDRFG
jgi:Tfp pilus assembly protein PilZ